MVTLRAARHGVSKWWIFATTTSVSCRNHLTDTLPTANIGKIIERWKQKLALGIFDCGRIFPKAIKSSK